MARTLTTEQCSDSLCERGSGEFSSVTVSLFREGYRYQLLSFNGEFDPGSGRTLAACLKHASRALDRPRNPQGGSGRIRSGARVSNT